MRLIQLNFPRVTFPSKRSVASAAQFSTKSSNYVLVLLTAIYVLNYLDRQILSILLPQIKVEFGLSDTQLGLLAGPTFAVTYAVLGIPMAIFADKTSRRNLIAGTLAWFSAMTFGASFVGNFLQLGLARFCTGVGEAGTTPAASSMISDLFPPEKRTTALGIYTGGLNIGVIIAFFGGGWIAARYGWRITLMSAGVPGLILGILFLGTVREPKRGGSVNFAYRKGRSSFSATVKHLLAQNTFRYLAAGVTLCAFTSYAGLAFNPLFLSRSHHLAPREIGTLLALLNGVLGLVGNIAAGLITDHFGKSDARWGMWVSMFSALCVLLILPLFYLSSDLIVAVICAIVPATLATAFMGPAFATVQALSPVNMRAKAQAFLLFVVNIIALSLGPQWVGIASDLLHPYFGNDSLRYSLVSAIIPLAGGAWCFWRASYWVGAEIAQMPAK